MDMSLVTTIPGLLEMKTRQYKDKVAFIDETRQITYNRLNHSTSSLAKGIIDLGIKKDERVLTYMWNSINLVELYYGLPRGGAVCVFTNPAYTPRELNHMLTDSKATAIVTDPDLYERSKVLYNNLPYLEYIIITGDKLPENVHPGKKMLKFDQLKAGGPLAEDLDIKTTDPAWIQYTSGTTGTPKGAELSHRALTHVTAAMIEALALTDKDILLGALPLFHSYASNICVLQVVGAGATEVIVKSFSPSKTPDTIKEYGITVYPAVPTMFTYILNAKAPKETHSSLRICVSAGAILSSHLQGEFEKTYGVEIYDGWGGTETCSFSTLNRVGAPMRPAGSCGVALSGCDVRVFNNDGQEVPRGEEGEMVIKGPHVMTCYINKPEETAEALKYGYYWTGDIVTQDENGYFWVKGRRKELIISGGFNIYPKEIEDVLLAKEGILEAAVVGIEDPGRGEVPKAVVVLEEGAELSEEEILNFLKENIAKYKQPKYIQIIKELPKTSSGKVKKFLLK
jgi:long-chain acyl-CoA synthetase